MLNRVELIGHLGADPEIRRTQAGDPIANFRLATSERWKDKTTGEAKERTEWHSVVVFNEGIAGVVERFLHKGSKVYVAGQLATRKWQDKDGNDRYTTEVVLQKFRGELVLLDSQGAGNRPPAADDADAYGNTRTRDEVRQSAPQGGGGAYRPGALDDDIPFAPEVRG